MDENGEPSPVPPPLPPKPPPVPGDRFRAASNVDPARSRRRNVLAIVLSVGCGGLFLIGLTVGFGVAFLATARDFELSEDEKKCVVTVADLEDWFEVEIEEEKESWEAERYFDRSVHVYYFYDDVENEGIQLSSNLTIEPKKSDALMMYNMEWSGLKLGNWAGGGEDIELEMSNETFQWGDESKFAYQVIDGERWGFAFVGRKGSKIFFVDLWGLLLEDPEEVSEFLTPHLKQYEKESFRKKEGQE